MERNAESRPDQVPLDRHDQAEPRRLRRKHRGGKGKKRANAAPPERTESVLETRTGSPQFYTSDERPAATIWTREIDETAAPVGDEWPLADSIEPAVDISRPVVEPAAEVKQAWVDDFAAAPNVPQQPEMPLAPVHDSYDSPPPPRSYFWNEPEARSRGRVDRDALPSIAGHREPPVYESAQAPESAAEPRIEHAVNPNDPRGLVPESPAEAVQPSAGGRGEHAAVQSGDVENSNFDALAADAAMPAGEALNAPFDATDFPNPANEALSAETPFASPSAGNLAQAEATGFAVPSQAVPEAVSAQLAAEQAYAQPTEHNMDQAKVVELAHAVRIDGVSAYEMFTAGRIDEQGLRRIVTEYLRGGNVGEVASQELLRQQLRFERDPRLRDRPVKSGKNHIATKRAANRLKQGTKSLLNPERAKDRTERLAEFAQLAAEKAQELFADNSKLGLHVSIAAIVVIYVAIIVLLVK